LENHWSPAGGIERQAVDAHVGTEDHVILIGRSGDREEHVGRGGGNKTRISSSEVGGPVALARAVGNRPHIGVSGEAALPIGIGEGSGSSHIELNKGVGRGDAGDGEVGHVVEVTDGVGATTACQTAALGDEDVRLARVGDDAREEVGIHRHVARHGGHSTWIEADAAAGVFTRATAGVGAGVGADFDAETAARGEFEDRAAGASESEGAADATGQRIEGGSVGDGELGSA
jgi:hypothetical protein